MNAKESEWIGKQMDQLRSEIACDFCALGLVEGQDHKLIWKLASGNANERFLHMVERPGRGLSGTVLKVGRAMPMNVAELICSRQLQEYPLLLAENLRSAYAIPVKLESEMAGVLLVGDRRKRIYRPEDRRQVTLAGERIAEVLDGHSYAASS